jgi:hypothetical protein
VSPYRVPAPVTVRMPPHVTCPECGLFVIPDTWERITFAMEAHAEVCVTPPVERGVENRWCTRDRHVARLGAALDADSRWEKSPNRMNQLPPCRVTELREVVEALANWRRQRG